MTVCLVIPVFNEEVQLEESVRTVVNLTAEWCDFELQVVIANNASTDGTRGIAERLEATLPNVRHEYLQMKGRGRALRSAWTKSNADVMAYMDVDLSTDLSFFPSLLEPLLRGQADVATGSRLLRPEWTTRNFKREIISRSYNRLLRFVFAPSFSDAQCGFKALTQEAARQLLPMVKDEGWFFDTELLLIADHLKFRIHDLPVRWNDDPDSRVRLVQTAFEDILGILRLKRTFRNELSNIAGRTKSSTV